MIDNLRVPADALARYDARNAAPEFNADRYRNVEGVGLVDLQAQGGPSPVNLPRLHEEPDPQSGIAKLQQDFNNGLITQEQLDMGIRALGPAVTNNNIINGENSNAFNKAMDEAAGERFSTYIEEGNRAGEMLGDFQMLQQLAGQIGTGQEAQIKTMLGPWAEMAGVDIANLGEAQAFQSIVDRLAPQLRPPGSGASSDFDARQFLSSLPSLSRSEEGNAIITETFNALMQHRVAVARIASEAAETGERWQEAEAKIRALGNPFEAFNSYNQSAVQPGGSGFVATEVAPQAVPRDGARPIIPDDDMDAYNALPPGTIFENPAGELFRKPLE
jgi:hypothetical protein